MDEKGGQDLQNVQDEESDLRKGVDEPRNGRNTRKENWFQRLIRDYFPRGNAVQILSDKLLPKGSSTVWTKSWWGERLREPCRDCGCVRQNAAEQISHATTPRRKESR
jgi:hypothetical protein